MGNVKVMASSGKKMKASLTFEELFQDLLPKYLKIEIPVLMQYNHQYQEKSKT